MKITATDIQRLGIISKKTLNQMVSFFKHHHDAFAALLFKTIKENDKKTLDELIDFAKKNKFDFNIDGLYYDQESEIKTTLLVFTCQEDKLNFAKKLLHLGADINNTDDFTPLEISIMEKRISHIKFCLENGADPNIHSDHGDDEINIFPPYLEFMRTDLKYTKEEIEMVVELMANAKVPVQARENVVEYHFSLSGLKHAALIKDWYKKLQRMCK